MEELISITETKEFKKELDKFIQNTTLKEFLSKSNMRGTGKTGLKTYVMLKLIEKDVK